MIILNCWSKYSWAITIWMIWISRPDWGLIDPSFRPSPPWLVSFGLDLTRSLINPGDFVFFEALLTSLMFGHLIGTCVLFFWWTKTNQIVHASFRLELDITQRKGWRRLMDGGPPLPARHRRNWWAWSCDWCTWLGKMILAKLPRFSLPPVMAGRMKGC